MPLRIETLRRRIRFELEQSYFAEAGQTVPLGYGCFAPILHPDYWHSFTEIFFMDEYAGSGELFSLPERWLDLGCHAGFFSLNMLWQHRRRGSPKRLGALLVDGDSRIESQIKRLIECNAAEGQFRFEHGAISTLDGPLRFIERACMASGTDGKNSSNSRERGRQVPVVTPQGILELFPPPYDLIKVDIEGGEHDLLMGYHEVLQHTSTLLFEWHSWHAGGGGLPQLQELAADLGFVRQQEFKTPHQIPLNGTAAECGVLLMQREHV